MGTKDSVVTSKPAHKRSMKSLKEIKKQKENKPIRKGFRNRFAKSQEKEK